MKPRLVESLYRAGQAVRLLALIVAPVDGQADQSSREPNAAERLPDPDASKKTPPTPPAVWLPRNGVIHPAPDATADATVTPPNVDPKMTIPPPGTPGSDVKAVPK